MASCLPFLRYAVAVVAELGFVRTRSWVGGGFLLAPGVGEVLSDLVVEGRSGTPIEAFSIGRFGR